MQGASWWTSFIQACLQSVWGRPHCLINQRTAMSSLTTLHCLQVKDTKRKLTDNFLPFHKGIMQKGLIIISSYHVSFPSFNIYCFKLNQLALSLSLSLLITKQTKYLQLHYFGSVLFLSSLLRTLAFTLMILSMWSSTILHWVWVPVTNKIQTHILIPSDWKILI